MLKETAIAIHEAAEEEGFEVDIRSDYSGRGMVGSQTYAIVIGSHAELLTAVAAVGVQLEWGTSESENFIEDCKSFRFDNMGRDSLVAY